MHRRIIVFISFIILNLALLFSTQAADVVSKSTDPEERAKVFAGYYSENPRNSDPTVFKYMQKWHEEDISLLDYSLSQPSSRENLTTVANLLRQSFTKQTVSFTHIALAYATYSLIASSDEDPTSDLLAQTEYAIRITRNFIERGDTSENQSIFDKYNNLFQIHGRILWVDDHNLHWLPYVNDLGVVSYRTLNELYGMRAPTLGLPLLTYKRLSKGSTAKDQHESNKELALKTAAYDGKLKSRADEFLRHEVNHGGQFDPGVPGAIEPVYTYYEQLNKGLRVITDVKRQLISDIFGFELAHELSFAVKLEYTGALPAGNGYHNRLVFPATFDEACESTFERLKRTITTLSEPVPLDYNWHIVSSTGALSSDGKTVIRFTQSKDNYYANTTLLKPFINQRTGKLYILPELILEKKLPKNRELDDDEILAPHQMPFEAAQSKMDNSCESEFMLWYALQLNPSGYNQLFGLQAELNAHGIPFNIWNGDNFLADEMITFFRTACDIFKQEVGPHMRWTRALTD